MSGDPAVVSAAVAVSHGTSLIEAVRAIGLPPEDWNLAVAVLNRADRIRADRDEQFAKQVAYYLARAMPRWR